MVLQWPIKVQVCQVLSKSLRPVPVYEIDLMGLSLSLSLSLSCLSVNYRLVQINKTLENILNLFSSKTSQHFSTIFEPQIRSFSRGHQAYNQQSSQVRQSIRSICYRCWTWHIVLRVHNHRRLPESSLCQETKTAWFSGCWKLWCGWHQVLSKGLCR